jgi:hypothetical protein
VKTAAFFDVRASFLLVCSFQIYDVGTGENTAIARS